MRDESLVTEPRGALPLLLPFLLPFLLGCAREPERQGVVLVSIERNSSSTIATTLASADSAAASAGVRLTAKPLNTMV